MLRYFNVILLVAALGAGLGYLSYCRLPAAYRSTARLVIPSALDTVQAAPAGNRTANEPAVQRAARELTSDATLGRALENSELISLAPITRRALSIDELRQSLEVDQSDEPDDVIVIHFLAPSAKTAQVILTSVIDAYLVLDSQRRQASEDATAQLIEQNRRKLRQAESSAETIARAQKLVDSWIASAADPVTMERLSGRRAALLLRRNDLQRMVVQVTRPAPAAAPQPELNEKRETSRTSAPMAVAPGTGVPERTSQLLEEDARLAARFGPEHPKRKAIRQEIELLQKYPAEQAQLLAERSRLLEQYGPLHPQLKAIDERLTELGIRPPVEPAAPSAAAQSALASVEFTPEARLTSLRAALEELDTEDHAIQQQIETANLARDVAAELAQAATSAPGQEQASMLEATLMRLERASTLETAVRPYLAMRPSVGVRSDAGPTEKMLRGAAIGAMIGSGLAVIIALASRVKK